jgi:HEAT repeat protein
MTHAITTCTKCKAQFSWDTDFGSMPNCPNCGFNPKQQYKAAGISGLIEKLETGDRYVSSAAAVELGKRRSKQAVDPLIKALKNYDAALASIIALGKIGDARAIDPLIDLIKQGEVDGHCTTAIEVLAKMKPPAIKGLIEALNSKNANIREEAASALGKINNKDKFKALVPLLMDKSANIRAEAASILGKIGNKRALEALVPLLMDKSAKVRAEVSSALGKIGSKRALEALVPLLKDKSPMVQLNTAVACSDLGWKPSDPNDLFSFLLIGERWEDLREMGSSAIVRLEEQLMGGESWAKREIAAKALGKVAWKPTAKQCQAQAIAKGDLGILDFDNPDTMESLLQALRDLAYNHRKKIIKALEQKSASTLIDVLQKLGDKQAVKELIAFVQNIQNDTSIRKEAASAVEKLTGERPKVSGCFIATACYGDINCPQVNVLRQYRDEEMLTNVIGRILVSIYYAVSPPIAEWLKSKPRLASALRKKVLDKIAKRLSKSN